MSGNEPSDTNYDTDVADGAVNLSEDVRPSAITTISGTDDAKRLLAFSEKAIVEPIEQSDESAEIVEVANILVKLKSTKTLIDETLTASENYRRPKSGILITEENVDETNKIFDVLSDAIDSNIVNDDVFNEENYNQIVDDATLLYYYGIIPPINRELVGGVSQRIRKRSSRLEYNDRRDQDFVDAEAATAARKKARDEISRQNAEKNANAIKADDKTIAATVCDASAKIVMQTIFGIKVITVWTEAMKQTCREIYEKTAPTTQCNKTIGSSTPDTNCYLCGYKIYNSATDNGVLHGITITPEDIPGLSAVCEHVLPIIQAVFFLGLYKYKDKENSIPENVLKLEYRWAHSCCNSIKSDISFLLTNLPKNNKPFWTYNEGNVKNVLNTIITNTKNTYRGVKIIQDLTRAAGVENNNWIAERSKSIETNVMSAIVKYLADESTSKNLITIGIAKCLNTSSAAFRDLVAGQAIGVNPNQTNSTDNNSEQKLAVAPDPPISGRTRSKLMNTGSEADKPATPPSSKRPKFRGGTYRKKKRAYNKMAGGTRQRKLTEYGEMFKRAITQKNASSVKRGEMKKLKLEVDDLAALLGKTGLTSKGGRKTRRKTRRSRK